MLGIEDYASDSDASEPKESLNSGTSNSSSKTKRAPKKFTIALPSLPATDSAENSEDERPAKKRRTGAGTSSLLSMLPKPKQNSVNQSQVSIGGTKTETLDHKLGTQASKDPDALSLPLSSSLSLVPSSLGKGKGNISVEEVNINQAAQSRHSPATDFFALSEHFQRFKYEMSFIYATTGHAKGATKSSNESTSTSSSSSLSLLSAAPSLPTFEPPEPSETDPYPGYYQLPSGVWAAHDPEYYAKFMNKWEHEYTSQLRALEKGTIKGFEGLADAPVEEIDALKEMEKAKKEIQEREEKKAVTRGAEGGPVAPKMNINVRCIANWSATIYMFPLNHFFQATKMNRVANSRHQLSTLLKQAYENREALEEKIAQGKRNRKEAGNKYGKGSMIHLSCSIVTECTKRRLLITYLYGSVVGRKYFDETDHTNDVSITAPQFDRLIVCPGPVYCQVAVDEQGICSAVTEVTKLNIGKVEYHRF
jgi:proline-rich protein PRCC